MEIDRGTLVYILGYLCLIAAGDKCNPNPCINGTCTVVGGSFKCACAVGYTGKTCCANIDDCATNPCVHGKCIDELASYKCNCKPGYLGATCNTDKPHCEPNPCNAGNCTVVGNGYTCTCPKGYTGNCDIVQCYNTTTHTAYVGRYDKTVTGRTCQRWDSQSPHQHGRTNPNEFPDSTLAEAGNYCRDPDNEGFLWCYTTDTNKRFETCGMSRCSASNTCEPNPCNTGTCTNGVSGHTCTCPEGMAGNCDAVQCYNTTTHTTYVGRYDKTVTGRTCQRWDSQSPHSHDRTNPNEFPDSTLADAGNSCRDPDNEGFLWCYTTDTNKRYETCNMSRCECYKTTSFKEYVGKWNVSVSGKTCQRWDTNLPHSHGNHDASKYPDATLADAANYCRDPDNSGYLWCYTTDTNLRWESCGVENCKFSWQ